MWSIQIRTNLLIGMKSSEQNTQKRQLIMVNYLRMLLNEFNTDAAVLRVFGRKVQRKIFGLVRVDDDFLIRSKNELYDLLNDICVEQNINI